MGPDPSIKSSSTLSYPRFSSDLQTVPWTDGKAVQNKYAESVAEWYNFEDIIPENNWNKLGEMVLGHILKY